MIVDDYVVLWSPHQRYFHVETVGEMLEKNLAIFQRGERADYIVLGFERTQSAADAVVERLKPIRDAIEEGVQPVDAPNERPSSPV